MKNLECHAQGVHEILNLTTKTWRSIQKILENERIDLIPKWENTNLKGLRDNFIEAHILNNLNRTNKRLCLLQNHQRFVIRIMHNSSKTHITTSNRCIKIHLKRTSRRGHPLGFNRRRRRRKILVDLSHIQKVVPVVERFHQLC